MACEGDAVAHLERAIEEQDQAGDERGQDVLERKTERDRRRAAEGEQRLVRKADESGNHEDRRQEHDQEFRHRGELFQQQAAPGESLAQSVQEPHDDSSQNGRHHDRCDGERKLIQLHELQETGASFIHDEIPLWLPMREVLTIEDAENGGLPAGRDLKA